MVKSIGCQDTVARNRVCRQTCAVHVLGCCQLAGRYFDNVGQWLAGMSMPLGPCPPEWPVPHRVSTRVNRPENVEPVSAEA